MATSSALIAGACPALFAPPGAEGNLEIAKAILPN